MNYCSERYLRKNDRENDLRVYLHFLMYLILGSIVVCTGIGWPMATLEIIFGQAIRKKNQ